MYNKKIFVTGFVRPLDITMAHPSPQLPGQPVNPNGPQMAPLPQQQPPSNATYLAQVPQEYRDLLHQEVQKQLQLEKAKHFEDPPLFIGTWKRVIQLVGLGVAAVILWEGGKWVIEQIWPSDAKPRPAMK